MKRWSLMLAVVLFLSGCKQPDTSVKIPTNVTNTVGAPVSSSPSPPDLPPLPYPVVCTGSEALSEEVAYRLLANLSLYDSGDSTAGSAHDYVLAMRGLQEMGWPPRDDATWTNQAWRRLDITPLAPNGFLVNLVVGKDASAKFGPWFGVACDGGSWKVQRMSFVGDQWLAIPDPIPGQDGELTIDLAMRLARSTQGNWLYLAQVATGKDLERGRIRQLDYVRGSVQHVSQTRPWTGDELRLTSTDATHSLGNWIGQDGKPTGDTVAFEKVGGIWKVTDHTERGQVLPMQVARDPEPSALLIGPGAELLNLSIGMPRASVEELMGKPDVMTTDSGGLKYAYSVRRVVVEFDASTLVKGLSVQSGSTNAGVRVGAPVAQVDMVYGPSSDHRYVGIGGIVLEFAIAEGKVAKITIHR